MPKRLLIIDDEHRFCSMVAMYFDDRSDLTVSIAHDGATGLDVCKAQSIDVVLLDQKLPDVSGSSLCRPILELNEETKILFVTAYPSFDNAMEAIKHGAFDYLTKPLDIRELELAVDRALRTTELERVASREQYRARKQSEGLAIIGERGGLREVAHLIDRAAEVDSSLLVTGETGTGKSLVAKAVHGRSARREGPFISLNCAALPADLVENELFGHARGAFTGARDVQRGVFEMAHKGTLLLDEIGAMPLALQPKLLAVLEERLVRRIGSETQIPIDVRVITATNAPLEEAIARGEFREDLYYRLDVLRVHLPPLRERREDLPALVERFLAELAPGRSLGVSEEEIAALGRYPWPGNVRELRNIVERAVVLQPGPQLSFAGMLTPGRPAPVEEPLPSSYPSPGTEDDGPVPTLAEVERAHIEMVLARCDGNLTRTARALGVALNTLKRKLQQYGHR